MPAKPKRAPKKRDRRHDNKGRPEKFSTAVLPALRALALTGALDQEMADAIEVSERTFRRWKAEKPEFLAAVSLTDAEMAQGARVGLYRRAVGFKVKIEKVFSNGMRMRTAEYIPPDPNAAFKILQAYDEKQAFAEKRQQTGGFDWADLVAMSMADREERARLKAIEDGKLIEGSTQEPERLDHS
jgi:hypothetical protein